MGTTGLIFAVIVVLWLAYLVPWYLSHRHAPLPTAEQVPTEDFADSMTIIRRGVDPFEADQDDEDVEISTPMTRRATQYAAAKASRTAVRRRRQGLIVHLVAIALSAGLAAFGVLPWWTVGLTSGLLVVFIAVLRFSVVALRRSLDERLAELDGGQADGEATVAIALPEAAAVEHSVELSIELSTPIATGVGSLLEPIPVTPATYVSKPMMPRSVRTIDLSAPVFADAVPVVPVTAEGGPDGQAGVHEQEVDTQASPHKSPKPASS